MENTNKYFEGLKITLHWSENPAFYGQENKIFKGLDAWNFILKMIKLDVNRCYAKSCYDKTKISLEYHRSKYSHFEHNDFRIDLKDGELFRKEEEEILTPIKAIERRVAGYFKSYYKNLSESYSYYGKEFNTIAEYEKYLKDSILRVEAFFSFLQKEEQKYFTENSNVFNEFENFRLLGIARMKTLFNFIEDEFGENKTEEYRNIMSYDEYSYCILMGNKYCFVRTNPETNTFWSYKVDKKQWENYREKIIEGISIEDNIPDTTCFKHFFSRFVNGIFNLTNDFLSLSQI